MQIVIDIPEDVYVRLFENGVPTSLADGIVMERAIRKGIPLSEVKTDILDKIRAKILVLDDTDYDFEGYYKVVTDALKIIDKYNAESEKV